MASIKVWQNHEDFILSHLCKCFINRNLFKIKLQKEKIDTSFVQVLKQKALKKYPTIQANEWHYFVYQNKVDNSAYVKSKSKIAIYNGKTLEDIAEASDQSNISALSEPVTKYYICYDRSL